MTDEQMDALFEDPRFIQRMYDFIRGHLTLQVSVRGGENRVAVEVALCQKTNECRWDTIISDCDSDSHYHE